MSALDTLRFRASYGVTSLLWGNLLLSIAAALFGPTGATYVALASSFLIAAFSTALWMRDKAGPTTRIVSSIGLAAQVALLVYQFEGSGYQIDMHMYFFATLAICAAWVDWRAIVGYAAVVAVHHLALYFLLPAAVSPLPTLNSAGCSCMR